MKWKCWSGILILFVIVFTITKERYVFYHFEGRSGSKSIIDVVKIVWEIVGHACRPKGEKRRPKNVQGKKGAVVVVTTTGPAAALLYYFRDQLRYD